MPVAVTPPAVAEVKPGPGRGIASAQLLEQFPPDDGKLVHMLVSVDKRRRAAKRLLERIELGPDLGADGGTVEPTQQAGGDHHRQGVA